MPGDDDQIVPYADAGPLSAKLLKNGTLKTYKGFPHGMPTTQADTINADHAGRHDQCRPASVPESLTLSDGTGDKATSVLGTKTSRHRGAPLQSFPTQRT